MKIDIMKNSQKFKLAHKIAKTYEGSYSACFAMALKEVNSMNVFEIMWETKLTKGMMWYRQAFSNVEELIREMESLSNANDVISYYADCQINRNYSI